MTRTAKCRQFDCETLIEQEPVPVCDGRQVVWVPQLCPECQARDANIRADYHSARAREQGQGAAQER